ncbi:MAG TPA: tyrosine-type recombinase/integrase [Anaerolineales bacterium]|nr:tyrosine-type recombinase/integrase [Anaerolineales bacterium]
MDLTTPIPQAITTFLETLEYSRSSGTARTYRHALVSFEVVLAAQNCQTVADLKSPGVVRSLPDLFKEKNLRPATQQLYSQAVISFYKFLEAEVDNFTINLRRIRRVFEAKTRKPGRRLPSFGMDDIRQIIGYVEHLCDTSTLLLEAEKITPRQHRGNLRDRAFILTLADTGLRVHEACGLTLGNIDLDEMRALVVGKGDKEAVVRFSRRAVDAIRDYLAARAPLDARAGKQLETLPLFARHNKAGEKRKGQTAVLPISTTTGRNIIDIRAEEVLGPDKARQISPHKFRHYFVTSVMLASGGRIRLAQKLARHTSIAVTERYHHMTDEELDRDYDEMFNQE